MQLSPSSEQQRVAARPSVSSSHEITAGSVVGQASTDSEKGWNGRNGGGGGEGEAEGGGEGDAEGGGEGEAEGGGSGDGGVGDAEGGGSGDGIAGVGGMGGGDGGGAVGGVEGGGGATTMVIGMSSSTFTGVVESTGTSSTLDSAAASFAAKSFTLLMVAVGSEPASPSTRVRSADTTELPATTVSARRQTGSWHPRLSRSVEARASLAASSNVVTSTATLSWKETTVACTVTSASPSKSGANGGYGGNEGSGGGDGGGAHGGGGGSGGGKGGGSGWGMEHVKKSTGQPK